VTDLSLTHSTIANTIQIGLLSENYRANNRRSR